MSIHHLSCSATCLLLALTQNAVALGSQPDVSPDDWQMKQIYQPSEHLLERERRGFINIYDSFTDKQVDHVMDHKFDRLQNMMFIRVKQTDTQGEVLTDPETGEDMVDDDGCD